jgi:hypothetical protein
MDTIRFLVLAVAGFVEQEDFDFPAADVALVVFVVAVHGSVEVHDFDFRVHFAVVRDFVVAALFVVAVVRGFVVAVRGSVVAHDFGFLVPVVVRGNRFFYRYLFLDLGDAYRFFPNSLN